MVPPVVSRSVPVPLIRLLEEVLAKVMLWMLRSLLSVMVWLVSVVSIAVSKLLVIPAVVVPGMVLLLHDAAVVQVKEFVTELLLTTALAAGERRRAVKSERAQSARCKDRRPR